MWGEKVSGAFGAEVMRGQPDLLPLSCRLDLHYQMAA